MTHLMYLAPRSGLVRNFIFSSSDVQVVFALWVWAIYLTFPGTYSTQPAVTTQTFGHKYGGFIYAFLFSSDIINNLLVAILSSVSLFHNYAQL